MKKLFLTCTCVLLWVLSFAAIRYWVGGGASTAWNATSPTNWALTSGGANNQTVPSATDNAIFDGVGASANGTCSVNGSTTIAGIDFTGFTGTIGHNNNLIVNGNLIFSTGMTIGSGVGTLTIGGASSIITMNGKIWNTDVTIAGTVGKTFSDAFINNNTVSITVGQTITLNGLMTLSGLNTPAANVTFAGTFGWICNIFNMNSASTGATYSFLDGLTYRCKTNFSGYTSRVGAPVVLTSSHATNRAIIILDQGAACAVLANFTRIDASGGRPINTFQGTVTDCVNINSFSDLKTVGLTW